MHLVNGTGNSPSPGRPTPRVVKQDKLSRGSVDTTKTRSDPQRVRMCSGERPIDATKGKHPTTEAFYQPPPPNHHHHRHQSPSRFGQARARGLRVLTSGAAGLERPKNSETWAAPGTAAGRKGSWPVGAPQAGASMCTPPQPPYASTGLSKRGVGVEPPFAGFFGTAGFGGPNAGLGVSDALCGGKKGLIHVCDCAFGS